MHFTYILFAFELLINIVSCFHFLKDLNVTTLENTTRPDVEEYEDEETALPRDYYSYVAIIDILFQDGTKRTCSGAIIHENVVITAAHCFILGYQKVVPVEMSASFIITGTKNMYDTGYEQFMPIERILLHPNYTGGWTADLALVYTNRAMNDGIPGRIVPLAVGKGQIPVDSNVTVLSWGESDVLDDEVSTEEQMHTETTSNQKSINSKPKRLDFLPEITTSLHYRKGIRQKSTQGNKKFTLGITARRLANGFHGKNTNNKKIVSRKKLESESSDYVEADSTSNERKSQRDSYDEAHRTLEYDYVVTPPRRKTSPKMLTSGSVRFKRNLIDSKYNVRPHLNPSDKSLTVAVFNFVNNAACMRLINKSMPAIFSIKNKNEALCYKNEEQFITFDDSGAPALQHGRLVAVTVGGTECDGEHVAVGMKITCFCPWIVANLPQSSDNPAPKTKCCTDCCKEHGTNRKPLILPKFKFAAKRKQGGDDNEESGFHHQSSLSQSGLKT